MRKQSGKIAVMVDPKILAIASNPEYQKFVRMRARYSWFMTGIMLVLYFGYIYLVAFNKTFLAQPIGSGVTTLSIPVGIGLIVFTVVLTSIYVRRCNQEFDALSQKILKEYR